MIPAYRRREILKLYSVFNMPDDIERRRVEFMRLLKKYYKWADSNELRSMYRVVYEHEIERELQRIALCTIETNMNAIVKVFSSMDDDKNGTISIAEFVNFAQPFLKDETAQVFADADTNQDGVLSVREFACYIVKHKNLLAHFNDILASALERRRADFTGRMSVLFTHHPDSPSDMSWRPSLSTLNSPATVRMRLSAQNKFESYMYS